MILKLVQMFVGLASGAAVGSGFVAVLTMLGVVPRLIQLSKSQHNLKLYTAALILGTFLGVFLSFTTFTFDLPKIILPLWGLLHGIFIGMVAAALTEVLNVYPIIAKRIGLSSYVLFLIMAIVFGKIVGSLFQWLIFVK